MGLVVDFAKFTKNCLKKDKITKVGLEGPAFKLLKGKYRNYIKLNKPLPLHGASGRLTILVDFFFNKDLDYLTTGKVELKYATTLTKLKAARYDLEGIEEMIPKIWSSSKVAYNKDVAFGISHWGPKRKLFYRARPAIQSSHIVYSRMKILSIIRILVDKQFGYGYLKETVVRCANQKEYTFKEADFLRIHLNDIKDMYLLYAQNKLHHLTRNEQSGLLNITMPHVRCASFDNKEPYTIFYEPRGIVYQNKDNNNKFLMRVDEVYMFGDGTLKKVRDKLDYMLHKFKLGYNDCMSKRAWTDKDKKQTASMLEKIEKTLLTRWIMRSLECFIGDRRIKTHYRLLTRIE
ncbi:hypothetical protein Tco_0720196 [Tanacetum coccineum]